MKNINESNRHATILTSIPKLGFGLMRLPLRDGSIDIPLCKNLVDTFLSSGFSYFDAGYFYMQGKAESVAKEILVKRHPRDKYVFATKMPIAQISNKTEMELVFNIQQKRTGLDRFDFYLLHGLSSNSQNERMSSLGKANHFNAWDFLRKKKASRQIGFIGFSFHDTSDCLENILKEHPYVDFVQLQINYLDWQDNVIQSKACYDVAKKYGIPVIVMGPNKGGLLANLPLDARAILKESNPHVSEASWALRFAASLDNVVTVLSGMSSIEEMQDNVYHVKQLITLSESEKKLLDLVAYTFRSHYMVECTGCYYCINYCPSNINIPKVIELINHYCASKKIDSLNYQYRVWTSNGKKASSCIKCGKCVSTCPQKLDIEKLMTTAVELFENGKEPYKL